MGVPKFYRWLSERYPLINQAVTTTTRVEVDALYLDMNGIVHNATHTESEFGPDPHRIYQTETQIFTAVFQYIDKLFRLVKPTQLLFMALDGVAPRAKMNQQRQRRFRAAADSATALQDLRRRGEVTANDKPFDSNCITPGTAFMKNLSDNLKYFIRKKLKEDVSWQRCKIILSGAEVPGEGEHKIMLFIRNMKMQLDYNPNMRHCLYGLDADLIFLSLVSHEPHFVLLREEVVFGGGGGGGGGNKQYGGRKVLQKMDEFQFLHISLLREYLFKEYESLSLYMTSSSWHDTSSAFNLERIIDDWITLSSLVGNDFLPHLPSLDIGEGGLDTLFRLYKDCIMSGELDGYITHHGTLNVTRLEVITRHMGELEEKVFEARLRDAKDFDRKKNRRERREVTEIDAEAFFDGEIDAQIAQLSVGDNTLQPSPSPTPGASPSPSPQPARPAASPLPTSYESGAQMKAQYYRDKFPEWYDRSIIPPSADDDEDDAGLDVARDENGSNAHGRDPEFQRRKLVKNYLEGLMWIQQYYYSGVPSWKWFYRYRYSPLASDMVNLGRLNIQFELGRPFRPLEQLLGTLPPASRNFLPQVYAELMIQGSSIADFYPETFEVDMNGKRNPWEGIALIPFIDEKRLLTATQRVNPGSALSTVEKLRNIRVADEFVYEYDPTNRETYPSLMPNMPAVVECHSKVAHWKLPPIPLKSATQTSKSVAPKSQPTMTTATSVSAASAASGNVPVDLLPPTLIEADDGLASDEQGRFIPDVPVGCIQPYPGFPYLAAIPSVGRLDIVPVNIFGMESKKDSVILSLTPPAVTDDVTSFAAKYLRQRCWVEWPYLKEAQVVSVFDRNVRHTANGIVQLRGVESDNFQREVSHIKSKQWSGRAIDVGDIKILMSVQLFEGMKRMDDGSIKKQFNTKETIIPIQLVISHNPAPDTRYIEQPPPTLQSTFPINQNIIYIGSNYYGCLATITGHHTTQPGKQSVNLLIQVSPSEQPFGRQIATKSRLQFYPSYMLAKVLDIHPLALSKICSTLLVTPGNVDIGLRLKYSKQGMCVAEYSRRVDSWNGEQRSNNKNNNNHNNHKNEQNDSKSNGDYSSVSDSGGQWEYSEKAVALLAAYKKRFPAVFAMLNNDPNQYKYDGEWLCASEQPNRNEVETAIKEVSAWLTTVGISNLMLVPCSSVVMADRGAKAIEVESTRLTTAAKVLPKKTVVSENVPLAHLYLPNPAFAWSPTEVEAPELGDRIVSIRSDSSVPLGLRGTVVAVHGKFAEIVFDEEFISGQTLNGRVSNLRGFTLAFTAFLNVSKPRIIQLTKPKDKATASAPQTAAKKVDNVPSRPQSAVTATSNAVPSVVTVAKPVTAAPNTPPQSKLQQTANAKAATQQPTAILARPHEHVTAPASSAAAAPVINKSTPQAVTNGGAKQGKWQPKVVPTTSGVPQQPDEQKQSAAVAAATPANEASGEDDDIAAMWNKIQQEEQQKKAAAATAVATPNVAAPTVAAPAPQTAPVDPATAIKSLLGIGMAPTQPMAPPVQPISYQSPAPSSIPQPLSAADSMNNKVARAKAKRAAVQSAQSVQQQTPPFAHFPQQNTTQFPPQEQTHYPYPAPMQQAQQPQYPYMPQQQYQPQFMPPSIQPHQPQFMHPNAQPHMMMPMPIPPQRIPPQIQPLSQQPPQQ